MELCFNSIFKCASVITVSPQVCICAQVYSVCIMIFIKNNEIDESYKLCQVRGKHTVGGIVFYKHLFLVFFALVKVWWQTHHAFNISLQLLYRPNKGG